MEELRVRLIRDITAVEIGLVASPCWQTKTRGGTRTQFVNQTSCNTRVPLGSNLQCKITIVQTAFAIWLSQYTMTSTSKILSFYRAFAVDLTFLWFWSHFAKAVCTIVILHCKFDLRGTRVSKKVWLTNCGLVPPRVLVCQHDGVTKPISTVVMSRIKRHGALP